MKKVEGAGDEPMSDGRATIMRSWRGPATGTTIAFVTVLSILAIAFCSLRTPFGTGLLADRVIYGDTWQVRLLLVLGTDPNATRGSRGISVLGLAYGSTNDGDMVDALLAAGADPNRVDECGFRPLYCGILSNTEEPVAALLSHGADPNLPAAFGRPPLWYAERLPDKSVAELLKRNGATPTAVAPQG